MFVEPAPGSGFDKVAPGAMLRRVVRFLSRRREQADLSSSPAVQQQGTVTDATEAAQTKVEGVP